MEHKDFKILNLLKTKIAKFCFACFFVMLASVCFFGCKKKDNLNSIAKTLTNYTLNVDFDNSNKTISATEQVDYVNKSDAALNQVKFHLYPKYFEQGATNKVVPQTRVNDCYKHGMSYCEFNLTKLQVAGSDVGIVLEGENDGILVVNLLSGLIPSERVKIYMEFNIKLPNCEHRFGYGDDTTNLANFYPIACVYEQGGFSTKPYNANGDPFYSDVANYEVNLTLNSNLVVAGTGVQTELSQKSGKTVTKFSAKVVRDFACVVSEKFALKTAKAGKVDVLYYYYDDANADLSLKAGVDAINTFSGKFGEYPYQNFSIVKCDFMQGGMEYPNLVMIDQSLYNEKDKFLLEYVIAHETAHQWWYSVIGNDEISEPWLDEALTEYSTVLYFEEKYGKEVGSKLIKTMEMQTRNHSSEDIFKATTQYKNSIDYSLNVYTKGALAFNEVRKKVGDEVFFETLKEYYNTYMFQNVNGAKFVDLWNKKGIDIDKIISEYK